MAVVIEFCDHVMHGKTGKHHTGKSLQKVLKLTIIGIFGLCYLLSLKSNTSHIWHITLQRAHGEKTKSENK